MLAVLDAYADHAAAAYEQGFRGCSLLNAAAELPAGDKGRASSTDLSATNVSWNELIAVTGQVTSLNVSFDVSCTSACSAGGQTTWSRCRVVKIRP